jgi:large subunit ribosomal protein L15
MAQLHTIKPAHKGRNRVRVGRGGKRGTYSGRGIKGQKSRASNKPRPPIRDLIKRFPKLRGDDVVSPQSVAPVTITLGQLSVFGPGSSVTAKTLAKKGILPSAVAPGKIVDGGTAPAKLNIVGIPVTAAAKKKLEDAGGTVK